MCFLVKVSFYRWLGDLTAVPVAPIIGWHFRYTPAFSPHDTVWSFYRRAVKSGKWEKAMVVLVKKLVKMLVVNPLQPVDTMGNLLAISVHAANIQDIKSEINPAKASL